METINLENPHWEALTAETQAAFRLAGGLDLIPRYYLVGGTGLALHLGHRYSIDLDFFSEEPDTVGPVERAALRSAFKDPSLTITLDKDAAFTATWQGVGISFFRLDLYPLVGPIYLIEGIRLASVEEIGAMKLAAIIGRGTRKDYVDLYFILQKVSLEGVFQLAARKYAQVRTFAISATRAMAYLEDAEAVPMPRMIDRTPWPQMKRFLEKQALDAGRKHLEDLWEVTD